MSKWEIRDSIHGFIEFKEQEIKGIVDKQIFQRLRGIKQLALACLLYPGATHTRFEHSLGVMYIADRMGKTLELSNEDLELLRHTALLHDLGHGPFSHVSENVLESFADDNIKNIFRRYENDKSKEKIHELITMQLIILENFEKVDKEKIVGILLPDYKSAKEIREAIINFLRISDHPPDPILREIISGPIDADKQDYLLRDSYFCGVKYGVFDIDRLHNTLEKVEDSSGLKSLAINEDGIHALEQYIMAKYYMNTQIYRHRLRRITDAMLTRAIELGIVEDQLQFLKDLYLYDGSEEYLENYKKWDDEKVLREIIKNGKGKSYEIVLNLKERKLFKEIYNQNLSKFSERIRERIDNLSNEEKKEIEERIGELLGFNRCYIIIDVYKIKSAKEEIYSEGEIQVRRKGTFREESTLFKSIDEAMQDKFIAIYAPASWTTDVDKDKKKRDWKEKIEQIIYDKLGGGDDVKN